MRRFELALPNSVSDCIAALSDGGGEVKLVAGGTDLYPNMKRRHQEPRALPLDG